MKHINLTIAVFSKDCHGIKLVTSINCIDPTVTTRERSTLRILRIQFNPYQNTMTVFPTDTPARIDHEPSLGNVYLLSEVDAQLFPQPFSLLGKGDAYTVWQRPDLKKKDLEEHVRSEVLTK